MAATAVTAMATAADGVGLDGAPNLAHPMAAAGPAAASAQSASVVAVAPAANPAGAAPLSIASDALARVARLLDVLPDGSPLTDFLPDIAQDAPARARRHRAALASILIAGLELARDGGVLLDQEADWRPIHVTRRVNGDAVADDPGSPA
jgi:hypothetical protein